MRQPAHKLQSAKFILYEQEHKSIYASFTTTNKNTVDSWLLSYGIMEKGPLAGQDVPKDISVEIDDPI